MTFVDIVLFILRYGLPFISLIREIWDLIKDMKGQDAAKAMEAKAQFKVALKTKDVDALHKLRASLLEQTMKEVS